jgi:hypothetical protein
MLRDLNIVSRAAGYVEHIATGQRRYFSELTDALEFVAALGAMPFTPIVTPEFDDRSPPL